MLISARITGVKYTPFLCKALKNFKIKELSKAIENNASFILNIDGKQIALSWWVSAKRTRSYPFARVYDTLSFQGKRVTIIPVMKDEGKDGDRDFLQWDTISLMSLLGVYVIVGYYRAATKNTGYKNKITNQRFDYDYIKQEIKKLLSYQSDALHWNLSQTDQVGNISKRALSAYKRISKKVGVKMHSENSAKTRIGQLLKGKKQFMNLSRSLAKKAQKRESVTIQPKERLNGIKAMITIKNYLGGHYYFTCDEAELHNKELHLIEGKHTKMAEFPSLEDIKDGLLKMVLYTNLEDVKIEGQTFNPVPTLKLTTQKKVNIKSLEKAKPELIRLLKEEARKNNFEVTINDTVVDKGICFGLKKNLKTDR